ncbi:MAG: efflux RND transporter periplasmic adaptor subunit [Planctomycetota bacterium]|jgi:multidrug efflux pump subunit AcrA (membrane-fusion protein)|nr:MAG: efflux RND transporter periplasmic adaptor subunit [Planctomycetota bacterium]
MIRIGGRRGSALAAAAMAFLAARFAWSQPPAPPAVPVAAALVSTMKTASGQPFVGTVLPARTSDVGSAVDGRLTELPIVDGQHVAENEPIAQLLRGLLEIERAGATAELDRRRQVLGELQAGSRPEEIEQARAAVAGFEARLSYAKDRLARLGRLAERGTSTADELNDAQTELRAVEAQLRGSRAALELVETGPRKEQIAQAAAAAAVQEAEVQRIDDQLAKHTIRAPFSGWVVERFTEKGQWVARGGLIARIAELDTLEIEAQVPESSLAALREGAHVRLEFDAAADQAWIGTVARVVPQADLLSRSFPVRIRLENRIVDGVPTIKGGMLARAWLPVGAAGEVTVVPKDALVLGGAKPLVFCIDPSSPTTGVVRPVEVALGAAVEGYVAVRGTLEPGALVVVRGNERLRPGMQVTFTPPTE